MKLDHIYIFHGRGGNPGGSALRLENKLRPNFPHTQFHRPPVNTVEDALQLNIEPNAVVIGISLGGLIAAKLQETRPDLAVMTLSSPTRYEDLKLLNYKHNVVSLYSSLDSVIEGRTNWQDYTNEFYDVPWMKEHLIDSHIYRTSYIVCEFLQGQENVSAAVAEIPEESNENSFVSTES